MDLHESGTIGKAWKRTSTAKDFWFFNFDLEFLNKTSKFWADSYKNASSPPTCRDHGLYGHKLQSFPPNRSPKMRESQQFVFGLRLVSKEFRHPTIQTRIVQHFGRFFHQINVRQSIGRKDYIQTSILTSRRLDSILYEAAQNFEVFSNIQKWN